MANQLQPIPWVLTHAAHPIASKYHYMTRELDRTSPFVSLLRVQDCTELLLRYACIIQLAQRYTEEGDSGDVEQRILSNLNRPEGLKPWLDLLEMLTEEAEEKGWQQTHPIHEWLFEGGAQKEKALDLFNRFCELQDHLLLPPASNPGASGKILEQKAAEALPKQFSSLNRLLENASFLKTWTLLHRFKGITRAWMGMESPKDSSIQTPKRFEGHFIIHWGRRRFLSLSPYISMLAGSYSDERFPGLIWKGGIGKFYTWIQSPATRARRWVDLAAQSATNLREIATGLSGDTLFLLESVKPLINLLTSPDSVSQQDLAHAIDTVYEALKVHRITPTVSEFGNLLREKNLLPNEQSTENLIRFLVDQILKRSPVPIPELFVSQFWKFFSELQTDPHTKGLMEINYDILRHLLRIYEPLLVEGINLWKETRRMHREKKHEFSEILERLSRDFQIFRRQVLALRHIKRFLEADPQDFSLQAKIVAQMVTEFGPFFIKFAQVAATHTDFLPKQIAKELESFQEEVPPMPPDQMLHAVQESFGESASIRYYGLDPFQPLKSGSIASVYLAKKPFKEKGNEVLRPVIIKVAREDLEREFLIGESVLDLAILSTHYWAPHSKISPFLEAWMDLIRQWAHGFGKELDFQKEASVQRSFNRLSSGSRIWSAPGVYASTNRIVEMEYVQHAMSLKKVLQETDTSRKKEKHRQRIAENLIFTVLLQAFQQRLIHGDLHPGNILIDRAGKLHLIDWGNCISLKDRLTPLLRYVQGTLMADPNRIAEALVAISSDPPFHRKRIREIRETLRQTLERKGVRPLLKTKLLAFLRKPGEDLQQRIEAIPHLLSNTQSLGIVIESDYLQMSRSLSALLGTYLSLFPEGKKSKGLIVLSRSLAKFPYVLAREKISFKGLGLRNLFS